jgi:hypothetical protein
MTLVAERPNFGPEQIRSFKEVKLGDEVIPVYFKNVEAPSVKIIGYFVNDIGKGFLVRNHFGGLEKMFFTDKGLIPYSSGKWNPTNWIKKAEK